ncbi:MAG: DsbA family protein [Pseudomonadota bacterium]
MTELNIDLYWSFRSPFCYLVTKRLLELEARYRIRVQVKLVYPLVLRVPDYFLKADPRFFSYLLHDVARTAEMDGIPFGNPEPDPIVMEKERKVAAPNQPHIYRLTRMAQAASRDGSILPLVASVSALIWSGQVKGWHESDHLEHAVAAAGFDLAALDRIAETEAHALDAQIAEHDEDLKAAGHWGVPTMVFNNEPFFGQDRVEQLLWRMRQHGLEERA